MKGLGLGIRRSSALTLWLFLSAFALSAQTLKVTGVVIDDVTKETLPGVTVMVKGTSIGTVTDMDGKYLISVDKNKTLVFSYIGYESKEISNVIKPVYNVALKTEAIEIDDVVVLGTRMKKSDLTGAIGSISEKQLKEVPSVNLTSAMQGKVAGVFITNSNATPGGEPSIKVRGVNSINFGQKPIYVVDGIVVDQGIGMLNPDDIASIEVLKDASSKAIYGYRAANGVVVVTTKKGKQGVGKINYDGWVGFSHYDKSRMETLGSKDLMDLRIDAFANHYMDNNPAMDRADYINNVLLGDPSVAGSIFSAEELYNGRNNITNDWLSPLTRTGVQQNHSVNFSGASDKTNYYLGFSYSNQKGLLVNSDYKRYGGKLNLEQEVKSWLKVGTNTTFSRAITHKFEGGNVISDAKQGYNQGGSEAYSRALRANPMQNIDDRYYMYWQGVASMDQYNPMLSREIDREQTHDRLLSANYIEVTPIKGLRIRTNFSIDYFNKQDNIYIPSTVGQSVRDNWEGGAWQWKGVNFNWQWDNSISYEAVFKQKHRLFAMVATGMNKYMSNKNDIVAYGFPSDDLGYYSIGASFKRDLNTISSDWENQSAVSFVERVNYTYDNKYYLTVSVRQDGSSKFATGNKWGTFPSFSAAWNVSEESFMKKQSVIDLLKLRVGYGIVGNQAIPSYAYASIYKPQYTNGTSSLISDGRMGNPDIRWEKQKQFNVGFDVSFWNDRLSLTGDYFYTVNSDLLMEMSLSPTIGFKNKVANVGELENKGFEFTLNSRIIDMRDFKWNLSANISHDKNTVKKLYNGLSVIWKDNSITSREGNLFVGQPVNTFWAFKVDKIAQEEDMDRIKDWVFQDGKIVNPGDILPVDKNGDKKITYEDDMFVIGKKDPKFYGGLSTDLSWENLTLSASFTYSYGAKKYSWMYGALMDGSGTSAAHKDMLDRWTPENRNTNIPRAFKGEKLQRFGIGLTDFVLLNASYFRCSALTLAYNFPSKLINPVCSNLRIYATANNLFTVTKYKGFDPESGESYPTARMFTFGVNVAF